MPKHQHEYPINNQVKMPYYIEFLLEKKLVNIHVKVTTKDTIRPKEVVLSFDNLIIKKLVTDIFGLGRWQDEATTFENSLGLVNWREVRGDAKKTSHENQNITNDSLEKKYCKEMRHYLLSTLRSSKRTLQEFNPKFNIDAFCTECGNANTIEEITEWKRFLDKGIDEAETIRNAEMRKMNMSPSSSVPNSPIGAMAAVPMLTPPINLSIQISQSQSLGYDEKELKTPEASASPIHTFSSPSAKPKIFSSSSYDPDEIDTGFPVDSSEVKHESYQPQRYVITPLSPTSPTSISEQVSRGEYTADMITFMYLCNTQPHRRDARIDTSEVSCCISTTVCRIPVFGGRKLYDIESLNLLHGYKGSDHFIDPETQGKIYKGNLIPAYEVRTRIFELIKEEDFYQAFLQHYADDYQKAGLFKWSNFNKLHQEGLINNFNDLFKYVINHPDCRSAKVFANMTDTLDDPFKVFMKTYLKDYQAKSYFPKRSIFLKKVRNNEINNFETTQAYGAEHAHTRTHRLLSTYPR